MSLDGSRSKAGISGHGAGRESADLTGIVVRPAEKRSETIRRRVVQSLRAAEAS